ncbi:MAG: sigma-70 family RNA polymerase sigma factor [Bacteroidota bacterium]
MDSRTIHIKLIEKAQRGDQLAFRKIYDHYKHSLFMVCLRYAKDRSIAQDYLQDAFINIYRKLKQFDPARGVFESWAKRVTVNICLGDIRKNTLYAVHISGAEQVESNDISILSELSLQEMLALIQELPYGYRTVFNMYVIDGFSHKEIAAELNISISTSKSQLMKARNMLKKKITSNQRTYSRDHG